MSEQPTLMTRLRAKLAGEIADDTLGAYRAAGASAHDLLVEAEERRAGLTTDDYWAVPPGEQAFFLCTWNAFALQTLGEAFVTADFEHDAGTAGFLPPVTAEQALAFFAEVEQWLVRARQAEVSPAFQLDLYVPAELPEWTEVEPCPMAHLHAMLSGCRSLTDHAEIALADLKQRAPSAREKDVAAIESLLVAARVAAEYAEQLHSELHRGSAASESLHERIESSIKDALARAYLVGQLAAMPGLEREVRASAGTTGHRLAGPGEPGFDPWCLTDPRSRDRWQSDPQARAAVTSLWSYDPDPTRTLAIQAEIDAAVAAGTVDYAADAQGQPLGNYYCCPWSAVYTARRPVTIDGKRLRAQQQFTFDVSAEEIVEGGPFKRELLLANFSPTDEIDYCDPNAGGHDE